VPRPSPEELGTFYRNEYFKAGVTATYSTDYTQAELAQKRLRADCVVELISRHVESAGDIRFLEVGCGEGFVVKSAVQRGWNVQAVDYQLAPAQKFNSDIVEQVVACDPNEYLRQRIAAGARFDVIVLQNVLEHVLEPEQLLEQLRTIVSPRGCLVVQVPNDFSALQQLARAEGRTARDYWFLPPQHLNYFNEDNLPKVAYRAGFQIVDGVTDFPIEMFLWRASSNYALDPSLGKHAHQGRVTLDLYLARKGLQRYVDFYRSAFLVGLGRNLCAVLKPLG
jgi:2-polyprenyl-3-methyl-5-hydroxy-6-metoxy-1,4-benzoquinol methylase